MGSAAERETGLWRSIAALFRYRTREGRIDTIAKVNDFVATRAAFVAQKKLYGYLKTRMGTRFVSMFTDEVFVESINVAKMHVFAACLSDLTVFCVSRALEGSALSAEERAELARECFRQGMAANAGMAPDPADIGRWRDAFDARAASVLWENAAATGEVFEESPAALVKWAPIAPELKKHDAEIVRNSIRFAWNEVRIAYRKRLDAEAVRRSLAETGA